MTTIKRATGPQTDERLKLLRHGQRFIRSRQKLLETGESLPSMIMACIAQGITTRDEIIRAVPRLIGHRYAHVAAVLDDETGADPKTSYWFRDENRIYHLHS